MQPFLISNTFCPLGRTVKENPPTIPTTQRSWVKFGCIIFPRHNKTYRGRFVENIGLLSWQICTCEFEFVFQHPAACFKHPAACFEYPAECLDTWPGVSNLRNVRLHTRYPAAYLRHSGLFFILFDFQYLSYQAFLDLL